MISRIREAIRILNRFLTRIFRRLKHFPFFILKSATYGYESCKRCGVGYRLLWRVEDHVWDSVFNEKDAPGCYCPTCFIELSEKKGIRIDNNEMRIEPFYFK